MKTRFYLCLFFLVGFSAELFAVSDTCIQNVDSFVSYADSNRLSQQNGISLNNAIPIIDTNICTTDIVSYLTLFVNTVNNFLTDYGNNLTKITIIIGLLGLLLAAAGLVGFRDIRKDLKEFKNNSEESNDSFEKEIYIKYESLRDEVYQNMEEIKSYKKEIEELQNKNSYHDSNLQKINENLYKITTTITDNKKKNKKEKEEIWLKLHHFYYKTSLFSSEFNVYKPALDHFSQFGTLEDIKDLEYIADNDPDETKRNNVRECIGMIRGRS